MTSLIKPLVAATFASMVSLSALADMPVISAQEFVGHAASGGMLEVESSEMLLKDGKASADTKAYAEKMIADHTTANEKLKTIATSQNLSVPDELSEDDTVTMKALETASGDPATYAKAQLAGHTAMIAMFESYASKGDNLELKRFAEEMLPSLKAHQEMAAKLPGAK